MRLLPLLVLLPLAAQAQDRLEADLDGDGRPEVFALTPPVDQLTGLEVTTGAETVFVPRIAFWGDLAGQEARLALSPAGSVEVVSGNGSVGRERWGLTLTIAHRRDEFVVAGMTYAWQDTLAPNGDGVCDLNFLSGRGEVLGWTSRREVAAPAALPLRDWAAGPRPDPLALCGLGG